MSGTSRGHDQAQAAWVQRVLGIELHDGSIHVDAADPGEPLAIWRAAKDQVDHQIGALQAAFRGLNDPLAQAVADRGLSGLTRDLQVGLQAALFDYQSADASGRQAAAGALRGAAGKLRHFLAESPALPLLEDNPFGIAVTIRTGLGDALDRIEANLSG